MYQLALIPCKVYAKEIYVLKGENCPQTEANKFESWRLQFKNKTGNVQKKASTV